MNILFDINDNNSTNTDIALNYLYTVFITESTFRYLKIFTLHLIPRASTKKFIY